MPPRNGEASTRTVRSPARAAAIAAAVPAEPPPTTTRSASTATGTRSAGRSRVSGAMPDPTTKGVPRQDGRPPPSRHVGLPDGPIGSCGLAARDHAVDHLQGGGTAQLPTNPLLGDPRLASRLLPLLPGGPGEVRQG